MNKLKILIANKNYTLLEKNKAFFESKGIEVTTCTCNGENVLDYVCKNFPDIVIMDMFMPKLDCISVIHEVGKAQLCKKPLFIVLSAFQTPALLKEVLTRGADLFIIRPTVLSTINDSPQTDDLLTEDIVLRDIRPIEIDRLILTVSYLNELGVPKHLQGYRYLVDAIITYADTAIAKSQLYSAIATKYDTTSAKVSNSIKYAINVTWERGDCDILSAQLEDYIHDTQSKPSDFDFILFVSNKLKDLKS